MIEVIYADNTDKWSTSDYSIKNVFMETGCCEIKKQIRDGKCIDCTVILSNEFFQLPLHLSLCDIKALYVNEKTLVLDGKLY